MGSPTKRQMLVLVALLASASVVRTAEPTQASVAPDITRSLAEGTDLPGLIRLAVERNPGIKAARAEWRAAIEELPQATALPDPMVQFDYFGANVETRVGPQEYRYGVSQAFPFPGTLRQAVQVASGEVRIKRTQYDRAARDLVVDLKLSYHELVYLRKAQEITRQNQELLNHILKAANTRFTQGKAKLSDVLKAQSQLAQLSYDLVLLRELEQVEAATVNALLDLPTASEIGEVRTPPTAVLTLSVEQLEHLALTRRQEVEIAEGMAEKSREQIRLTKLRNRPKFTLSAMRIETGEADMAVEDSGKDAWLVGLGVSIPLWSGRNRSRVRQAELLHEAAESRKRVVQNQTRADVKSVYFRLENARRLIELYEKSLIPQAKQAMEVAEQWHDGEVNDVSGFLETQGVWLNFNLARLRAVTDYQQYLARLERLVGGSLRQAQAEKETVE